MPRKTRKVRKHSRRTLRRIPRKGRKHRGGSSIAPPNSQNLIPSDAAFKSPPQAPLNSDNIMGGIA